MRSASLASSDFVRIQKDRLQQRLQVLQSGCLCSASCVPCMLPHPPVLRELMDLLISIWGGWGAGEKWGRLVGFECSRGGWDDWWHWCLEGAEANEWSQDKLPHREAFAGCGAWSRQRREVRAVQLEPPLGSGAAGSRCHCGQLQGCGVGRIAWHTQLPRYPPPSFDTVQAALLWLNKHPSSKAAVDLISFVYFFVAVREQFAPVILCSCNPCRTAEASMGMVWL